MTIKTCCNCEDGTMINKYSYHNNPRCIVTGWINCLCFCHQKEETIKKPKSLDLLKESKKCLTYENKNPIYWLEKLIKEVEQQTLQIKELKDKILKQTQGYLNRKAKNILTKNAKLIEEVKQLRKQIITHDKINLQEARINTQVLANRCHTISQESGIEKSEIEELICKLNILEKQNAKLVIEAKDSFQAGFKRGTEEKYYD